MPRMLRPYLALSLLSTVATSATAAPIQYEYSGVITTADPSTGVAPGTRFTGTFAYDPGKDENWLGYEGYQQYHYGKTPGNPGSVADGSGLTLQIGGRTILADQGGLLVGVAESEYPGQWGYRDANGNPAGPYTQVSISSDGYTVGLNLSNPSRSVFGSLAPPPWLSLADFPQAQLNVTEWTDPGRKTLYTGTIDTLTAVPEPATWAA